MPLKKLDVLVVDDSAFMRLLISDILSEDEGLNVVGTASDGKEAIAKVAEHKPDVVVLDMKMDKYDGLYAVKKLMKENPLPILILSALGNTDLEPIFDALKYGAVDYMTKPNRGNSKMRQMNIELINKVKSVARAQPKTAKKYPKTARSYNHSFKGSSRYDIIAIGASTGGPSAIEEVISDLPANLNVPVIVCQHMPANFIAPFVARLNALSPLNIVIGTESMVPVPGTVIVCPGDSNLILVKDRDTKKIKISFTSKKYPEYNNPSINALMHSVATHYGSRSMGVILTGMGKDGVEGLRAIREKGGYTIAQDKRSSVIYGMPKVATESKAAAKSLDIKEIGGFIVNRLED